MVVGLGLCRGNIGFNQVISYSFFQRLLQMTLVFQSVLAYVFRRCIPPEATSAC